SLLSWAKKLWPVQSSELKKIIPLLFLKFLISYIYSVLTSVKDPIVVTAPHAGAEVIPILKGGLVFPLSIFFAICYSKFSNIFKPTHLFFSIISFFLITFTLYGFFLYPNADLLSPHQSADWLLGHLGHKFAHWIAVYRNWIHALFFVLTEMWGQIVIFLLYWGFANNICLVSEAKRTYTLFIAAGNIAAILAGPIVHHLSAKYVNLSFDYTLQAITYQVLLAGVLILGIYWWMCRYVITNKRFYNPELKKEQFNEKTKLSLLKSIKHICSSKYLLSIAVLVIGCALSINMIEVTWKAHLKDQYPSTGQLAQFVGTMTGTVGVISLITVFFLGNNFLRIFGWNFSAQITPVVVTITGLLFFVLSYFQYELAPYMAMIGVQPLIVLILFGAFQNIISKVVKYSFFDSTKEMAYIPLDQESKVKGKAAIDMVGSRLGKSSSSWIQLFLMFLLSTSSIFPVTPYLIPILIAVGVCWYFAVRYINKELKTFEEKEKELSYLVAEEAPSTTLEVEAKPF
ncbi:MAG: NTP/NDP exchange transporter, partial [Simkania negevensis]|nr:NTP/NDP exchange transporter [Simkania negevensis]